MKKKNRERNSSFPIFPFSFFCFLLILLVVPLRQCIALGSDGEKESVPRIPEEIRLSWEDKIFSLSQKDISPWFHPHGTLRFGSSAETEAVSPDACPWEKSFCKFSLSLTDRFHIWKKSSFFIDQTALLSTIDSLQEEIHRDPINATFERDAQGRISLSSPSQEGFALDTTKTAQHIIASLIALTNSSPAILSLSATLTPLAPSLRESDLERFGITELLGEGRTNFVGSPPNRIANILQATKQFQGAVISPGEDFSFLTKLGPVDAEHGYLPELVIKQGVTEPDFGGGICQVSTTLFRAALATGMEITERQNHAYPVSYYRPFGMDATVYIPKPDFRFKNNTSHHIFLQTTIEGTEIAFQIYGTSDNRTVEIDGPHILERNTDGSMKTIFTQKVIAADGSVLIEDSFRSSYASPSKYPHPGQEFFSEKPDNWSKKQWSDYLQTGNTPD